MDLRKEIVHVLRKSAHAVGGISDRDKSSLRKALHESPDVVFTCVDHLVSLGKVQWAEVEGTSGIVLEHLVGVSAGDSLGRVCQIVDVDVLTFGLNALLEIVQDLGHVFPWSEWANEDIQESLLHVPDLSDTQSIIEIGNDGDAFGWDEQDIGRVGDILIDIGSEVARDESELMGGDIDGGLLVGEST